MQQACVMKYRLETSCETGVMNCTYFFFVFPSHTDFFKAYTWSRVFFKHHHSSTSFSANLPWFVFFICVFGCLTSVLSHKMVAQNSLAELVNCREEKPALFLVGIKRRLAGYVCAELLCPRFYILGSNQSCQVIFVILKI